MRFRDLDLNLLIYLDALLSEKSVSKAASRVNITQPAMSEALSRLRDFFHDELLVHVAGRSMIQTPLARFLAAPVREILIQVKSVAAATSDFAPATSDRKFSIMASDYVFDVLLKEVVARCCREAPGVRIEIRQLVSNSREYIKRADIDLLIVPHGFLSEGLPCEFLYEDPLTCVVWSGNRLVGKELSFEKYVELGHVCRSTDGTPTAFDEWFANRFGNKQKVQVVVPNFRMAFQAVEGTSRITVAHLRHARMYAKQYSLRLLKPPVDFPPITEYIQWHRHQDNDAGLAWFRSVIKSVAAEL